MTPPNNLGLYRLEGFIGRRDYLLQLHEWLTGGDDLPAIAISGEQGNGKSSLATAAAWNHLAHFADGVVRVGAAGANRFRLYDIVRTLDTVFGTTLTRISEERWGISILEQLYRRKRLLILDELSGATPEELATLVDIIGHLHEATGNSRILLIDRNFSPAIAELVQFQHIHLDGLTREEMDGFLARRAPAAVRADAQQHVDALWRLTGGRPYPLRLLLGLLLDYRWQDLELMLPGLAAEDGTAPARELVAFAVESHASLRPQAGPLLDRLVSAAGGATLTAVGDLFWKGLGTSDELDALLAALRDRALLDIDTYEKRVVMHPLVRSYVEQNAVLLGETWDRLHAAYYVHIIEQYQYTSLERWPSLDAEWGNLYKGADWCAARVERLWGRPALEITASPILDSAVPDLPEEAQSSRGDLRLARSYAHALAHYAFWRHPPGSLRWFAAGALASLALGDLRNYAWLLMSIGRQHFFTGKVEEAIIWLKRAADIFDSRDLLPEMAYAFTDLGTSYRIMDNARQAQTYFRAAFDCVAQLGDQHGMATAYMNLGSAYYGSNEFERAMYEYRKAMRIALRTHDDQQLASVLNSMGLVMEGLERYDEAADSLYPGAGDLSPPR